MKSILHCIPSLGEGGAERQLAMLTRQLPRYGWEVHVALLKGGVFENEMAPSTVVHRIDHRGNYDPRIAIRLSTLMRRIRPALVQTWLTQMDIYGGTAALSRRLRWIATERSSALAYPRRWSNRLRALLVSRADAVVANSRGGLEVWKRSASRQLQRVIPNAVTLPADAGDVPSAVPQTAPLVVYAGRLSVEKRLPVFLRAMAEVRRQVPAVAVICGAGSMAEELRSLARDLSLDDAAIFLGHVDDVTAIVCRAAVFVFLSRFEGLPNAVQEAMACGAPLVVSDIPAHREFLDGTMARLVDGDDVGAVAAAIVECVREGNAARQRADNALRRAAVWSPEAVAAEYDALYRLLIAS